jgi:hypothetical protein
MHRRVITLGVLLMALGAGGCQSPTDPDDTIQAEDVIDVTASPNPVFADTQTGGRTYRVVRGNNQPDDILPYDWHAAFATTFTFNSNANDKDIDIDFPVKISSVTVTVKQASGGIITPPTGSDTEKYEFVVAGASGSQVTGINAPVTMTFEVWYDLPSLRREAVFTILYSFTDDDGTTFQRSFDVPVAP